MTGGLASKICSRLFGCSSDLSARTKYQVATWYYLIGFAITASLTWILRDFANDWFASNANAFQLCQGSAEQELCGSQQVAIRISFANFCFFSLHGLVVLWLKRPDDPRVPLHGGLWLWKTLIWAGTLLGFFFVPSTALYGYAQIARIGSGFYLVLQLILLLDLIYKVNEWLLEQESKWAWALLAGGSLVCFGLGMTLVAFSYRSFAPAPSCSLNIFFITWSLVLLLLLLGVLFLPMRAHTAGLLTSAIVFLYCSFLLFSALNSEPGDTECRTDGGTYKSWLQIVGFVLALLTVVYSTLSAAVGSNDMFGAGPDDGEDCLPYRADFFYLVFALASMYIAMLFSDWQVSPSTSAFEIDQGWISTWVKMASKWMCELMYLWSVVAPAIFPNRDFSAKS